MSTLTIHLPAGIDEAQARLLLATGLFQEEHVSVGGAAEMAGLSYRAFLDALRERGIPAFVYGEAADIEQELNSMRALVRDKAIQSE